jgi:peptidoglycan hydrolase-like protein with peptidoglycan-binding domain
MQYVVQTGDTLFTIAQRFGTTVEAIVRANNLTNPDVIFVGQVLTIPTGTTPPVPVPPTPVPPSPQPPALCPVLSRGSRGPAVRRLQSLLVSRGFNPGIIDGIFGPNTESAVRAAQTQYRLPVTGVVDVRTWTALGQNCAVVPPFPIPPVPVPPIPVPPIPEYHCPVLRPGDRGPAVRFLQRLLKEKGLFPGSIDGEFGRSTERAVRQFQQQRGLPVTGVVNVATWEALGVRCAQEPRPPAGTPIDTKIGRGLRHILYTDKRVYSRGERVRITLSKTNITNDEVNLRYSTSQIIEITATNAAGNIVWRYSANRSFAQGSRLITIFPGGTQVINETWNQVNNAGGQVLPGTYTITVTNLATNVSLAVQITIR